MLAGSLSRLILGTEHMLPLIASAGASAALLFAVPASPMAQPRALIGGSLIATAVGLACSYVGDPILACALAAGVAILLMGLTRCLHPPGGAVAMTVVLNAPAFHAAGAAFLFELILLNSIVLVGAAAAYHRLIFGRAYPHHAPAPATVTPGGVTRADVDQVLRTYPDRLDVDPDDVGEVVERAEAMAAQRLLGDLRAADIMTTDVVALGPDDTLGRAYELMTDRRVTGMPVVDGGRLAGTVSAGEVIDRLAREGRAAASLPARQLMAPVAASVPPDAAAKELVAEFGRSGVRFLPVVDAERRLLGIVTQAGMIAALFVAPLHRD